MKDPAWPSPPTLRRMLYWGDALGERPHDHVQHAVPDEQRRSVAFVLAHGKDAHPQTQAMGWADCRICGTKLGSRDMTAFGFVWPEKAEHYLLAHHVWTLECAELLQEVLRSAPP